MPSTPFFRASCACLTLALAACTAEPPAAKPRPDPASLRNPPAGALLGLAADHGSHAWLGIPYAQPPLGELRWRAPRPLPRW